MQQVLAASSPADWRPLDSDNTLYVELPAGRVVIELAPGFAPLHAAPTPIKSIRIAADVPESQRSNLEVLRTDSAAFAALIESRRNRSGDFFKVQAGHIELCNVPIPVRERQPTSGRGS